MNQSTEQIKITGKGGARPGSGRKKGKKTQAVLDREATLTAYKNRIAKNATILFDAQISLAKGQQFLFKVGHISKKPILVEDPQEISAYLDRMTHDDLGAKDGYYYFITTKVPDKDAIDSMLDRAFGKATQPVEGKLNGELIIKTIQYGNNSTI